MRWGAIFGWGTALWLAAGVQANFTPTLPGALWLIGVAAGLAAGPATGAVVGAFAGLFLSVLSGSNLVYDIIIGSVSGAMAGLVTLRYSKHNLLVAMLTTLLFSALLTVIIDITAHEDLTILLLTAATRGGINALIMAPLYLLVMIFFPRTGNNNTK